MFLIVLFAMIMLVSTFSIPFRLSCPPMVFFTWHSYAYTSQQNGVANYNNHHFILTTQTLLLHDHVPQHFWGDVVLTSCYLINYMHSSVLNNQFPLAILFPHQPLLPLTPESWDLPIFFIILVLDLINCHMGLTSVSS